MHLFRTHINDIFRQRKSKDLVINGNVEASEGQFQVDTKDARFFPVLSANSNFGIDPTSSEFKSTEGMRAILSEQRRLRDSSETNKDYRSVISNVDVRNSDTNGASSKLKSVMPLVDRLKKKYKK